MDKLKVGRFYAVLRDKERIKRLFFAAEKRSDGSIHGIHIRDNTFTIRIQNWSYTKEEIEHEEFLLGDYEVEPSERLLLELPPKYIAIYRMSTET